MKKTISSFVVFALLSQGICFAAEENLNVFKTVYEPVMQDMNLPTVVQVELPNLQNFDVAILEKESMEAQPWDSILDVEYEEINYAVTDNSVVTGDFANLFDNDYETTVEFDLDSDGGMAFFTINAGEELTSDGFQIALDDYVSLPYNVSLEAEVDGDWKTIIAETELDSTHVNFPSTTAQNWKVTFWHSQPFRLREFKFNSDNIVSASSEKIVWLARPGESYLIYADAQAKSGIYVSESPDLLSQLEDVLVLELGNSQNNLSYKDPDYDADGVPDINDNCVYVANANQEDLDSDKLGDACEDHDRDDVIDSQDNCPSYSNSNQADNDGDGIGDACDDEESRVTEKLPWLPWAAMGFAVVVVGLIFWKMMKDRN
ncbi:MAG: thrombospondin type 3 repeat-containing protein [Candidatus Gracilibacteria bacterium]|jgi:hypothetical protein